MYVRCKKQFTTVMYKNLTHKAIISSISYICIQLTLVDNELEILIVAILGMPVNLTKTVF